YISIPERKLVLKKQVGKKLTLDQVSEIYPKPFLLGIVGETKTGKSTFMYKSLHSTKQASRTNEIYGEVIPIPESSDQYFVVIDGDGDKIYQQIDIMNRVDCLLVFVDHSESHQKKQVSLDRLKSHENFLKNLSDCLLGYSRKYRIHIVLNKQDLWEGSSRKEDLLKWFTTNTEALGSKLNCTLTTNMHSNLQVDSVSSLLHQISAEVIKNYDRKK
ncbi:GTPase domain-containing protein, partial [Acinetobacter baumannii]